MKSQAERKKVLGETKTNSLLTEGQLLHSRAYCKKSKTKREARAHDLCAFLIQLIAGIRKVNG
jgi:hypothetical protein